MRKMFYLSASMALIAVSISILYYTLGYKPTADRIKRDTERSEKRIEAQEKCIQEVVSDVSPRQRWLNTQMYLCNERGEFCSEDWILSEHGVVPRGSGDFRTQVYRDIKFNLCMERLGFPD